MASYYLGILNHISTEIYKNLTDWDSKVEFSRLNRGSREIAYSTISDIPFDINGNNLNDASDLAVCTASIFRINDVSNNDEQFLVRLRRACPNCKAIIVDTMDELSVHKMKRFAKACVKYQFNVSIVNSPQQTAFASIIEHYCHLKAHNVIMSETPAKRKATCCIEVPVDAKKRMCFFLDKAKQLALRLDDGAIQPSFNLPLGLQSYMASVDDYQLLDADELPAINFASNSIGSFVESLASKFVGCIISFGHHTFYITSGDAFIHNHALLDDCSTGITMADYHTTPTAVIKQKQFMSNTKFYELSIFYGFFEFLVVGCIYHDNRDGVVRGCLGSSLQDWKEEAMMSSALVYSPTPNRELVPSPRLLRNYLRMDSHRLWGFHLATEYISGFTPMIPIDFGNHASQSNKPLNTYHAASKLLNVCTRRETTKKADVVELFRLFVNVHVGLEGNERALCFSSMDTILKKRPQQHKYYAFLVEVGAFVEARVEALSEISVYEELRIFGHADWPLQIMNQGLKGQMKKERAKVVRNRIRN